jgi:hypothetical protein
MEKWKNIEGYEGIYQISDLGRVRSLDRVIKNCKTFSQKKGMLLKPYVHNSGYLRAGLSKEGKMNYYMIHRLVANAFLGKPEDASLVVMHMNDIKTDNRLENLKWGTPCENSSDAYRKGLTKNPSEGKFNEENHLSKPINQLAMSGHVLRRFPNSYEVNRSLGINQGNIIQVCKGRRNHAGGFKWAYACDQE